MPNCKFMYPGVLIALIIIIPLWLWLDGRFIKLYHKKRALYSVTSWLDRLWPLLNVKPIKLAGYIWIIALCSLIFALARPQGEPITITVDKPERIGYIVLDSSKSMQVIDTQVSRYEMAKTLVRKLLYSLTEDRLGIIIFEKDARQICPATNDKNALMLALDNSSTAQLSQPGSNPFGALRLALEKLEPWSGSDKYIVLLSDGETNGIDEWGQLALDAKQAKVHIITIGIGTKAGGYISAGVDLWGNRKVKRFKGKKVISKFYGQGLMDLARLSAGRYYYWQQPLMVKKINHFLDTLEKSNSATAITIYKEWSFYFLLIAVLLLLMESMVPVVFRRLKR